MGIHLLCCKDRKTEIMMNKPVHFGKEILDLSKTLMYEFHYMYMLPKYGNKVNICCVDTDRFVYEVEKEDFLKDFTKDAVTRYDTSG